MKMLPAIVVCLSAVGCAAPEVVREHFVQFDAEEPAKAQQAPSFDCPPLPKISMENTPFERRLWALTVIELYRQCAESKK